MNIDDLRFTPHSDMSVDDVEIVNEHSNLVNTGNFDDATALLNDNNYSKGFRASIFNGIQNKIRTVQEYLKEKEVTEKNEVISSTEPTTEEQFWLQDY